MSPDPASSSSSTRPATARGTLVRSGRLAALLALGAWLSGCIVVPPHHPHRHWRAGGTVVVPAGQEVVRVWDGGVVRRDPRSYRSERHRSGRDHDDD